MHKTIEDGLKSNECRWVFDTSPATFCCKRTTKGSYCAAHAKIVYVASNRPRSPSPIFLPVENIAPLKADEIEHRPDLVEALTPQR